MSHCQEQRNTGTSGAYPVGDASTSVQVFADPVHQQSYTGFDCRTMPADDEAISVSDYNDENLLDTNLSAVVDPIEQLLMSSTTSFNDLEHDVNININLKGDAFGQHVFPDSADLFYSHADVLTSSPTSDNPLMTANYFTNNESIYQMYQDADCNSLHDYSSISNIIYTKKVKEKLRRQRYASAVDLTPDPDPIPKPSKVFKTPSSSNLSTTRRLKLRSKSLGAIILNKDCSASTIKASPADIIDPTSSTTTSSAITTTTRQYQQLSNGKRSGSSSPTSKATNPFYHPPEILKRLTNP